MRYILFNFSSNHYILAITTKNAPSPTNTVYVMLNRQVFHSDLKLMQISIAVSTIFGALNACFGPYTKPHSATRANIHKNLYLTNYLKPLNFSNCRCNGAIF